MRPSRVYGLAALLCWGLAIPGYAAQQPQRQPPPPPPAWAGPPTTWWRDAQLQKELQLTTEQAKRIEAVFQAALPQLRQKRDELDAQEAELSHLVESDPAEHMIVKQADRVESVRASLNATRTLMVFRIRQILTPDQRLKMNALRQQWDRDHPAPQRQGPPPPNGPRNR